jgi:prevent-host-death family protein
MKFATTRELSSQTSRLLKSVKKKKPVVVTRHGKPSYLITAIEEDDLEDIVLAEYYDLERELARVKREDREGKTISLDSLKLKSKRRG